MLSEIFLFWKLTHSISKLRCMRSVYYHIVRREVAELCFSNPSPTFKTYSRCSYMRYHVMVCVLPCYLQISYRRCVFQQSSCCRMCKTHVRHQGPKMFLANSQTGLKVWIYLNEKYIKRQQWSTQVRAAWLCNTLLLLCLWFIWWTKSYNSSQELRE